LRRLGGTLVFGIALVFVWQSPADAHVAAPVKATNDRTEVLRLEPAVAGVRVRLVDGMTRLELRAPGHRIVVVGYEGEPYLRVDERGVYENLRSPATYLNTSIKGAVPPAVADAKAAPKWRRIGDGPTVRWHDHALHVPPGMKLGLTRLSSWERPITVDGRTVQIVGRITREPGRSRLPWLAIAVLIAIGAVLMARRSWARTVLALLAIVIVADAARVAGLVLYAPPWLVSRAKFLFDLSVLSIVGWGMAVSAAVLVRRKRRFEAASAAMLAGAALALAGGALEVGDLAAVVLRSSLSDALARVVVAVELGGGAGVAIASLLELRRVLSRPASSGSRSGSAPSRADGTRTTLPAGPQ
jgi:hypothetical protein